MGSPDFQGEEKLRYLVRGMMRYEKAGVDFLEINESCPNTAHGKPQDDEIANRLKYVSDNFMAQLKRRLPVIVKFSNDTESEQVPALMDLLFELQYDGINFGNTSTDYAKREILIDKRERRLYRYFTTDDSFGVGGGVSGRPLKESSLELAGTAVQYLKEGKPSQEFHVIRTGGIETLKDIQESNDAGISMNQWYTGYFENFSKVGHRVYQEILSGL